MSDIGSKIARIQQITGYTFNERLICAEALQMAAPEALLTIDGSLHLVKKNKNLESVGDTVIDVVLCSLWYNYRDDQGNRIPVGIWDKDIRQRNAKNDFLGRTGIVAGVDKCIIKHPGLNRVTEAMVANAVEAIIGAAYLDAKDNGLHAASSIMERLGINSNPLLKPALNGSLSP